MVDSDWTDMPNQHCLYGVITPLKTSSHFTGPERMILYRFDRF